MKLEGNKTPIVAVIALEDNEDLIQSLLPCKVQILSLPAVYSNIEDWSFSPDIVVFDKDNLPDWEGHWEQFKQIEAYHSMPSILVSKAELDYVEKMVLSNKGIFGIFSGTNWNEFTFLCSVALVQGSYIKNNELKSNELNRLLSTNYLVIDAKNAQLDKVKNELLKISEYTDENTKSSIQAVITEIERNLKKEFHYQLFKVHFEEVHPLFYKKLLDINTKLTDNNLKLLAFLKMGFNNDEISFLLNVSMSAVKKSIQRLKQKLRVKPEDSLREFLFALDG